MKNVLFFCLFFLSTTITFAQYKNVDGYMITSKGDTIVGKISGFIDDYIHSNGILFQKETLATPIRLRPKNCIGFGLLGMDFVSMYISAYDKTFFSRRCVLGNISLFEIAVNVREKHYFLKIDKEIVSLFSNNYLRTLRTRLAACDKIVYPNPNDTINKPKYNIGTISDLVLQYNTCVNSPQNDYFLGQSDKSPYHFNFSVIGGVRFYGAPPVMEKPPYSYYKPKTEIISPQQNIGFSGGFWRKNSFIALEMAFSSMETSISYQTAEYKIVENYKNNIFSFNLLLRQYLMQSRKAGFYALFGAGGFGSFSAQQRLSKTILFSNKENIYTDSFASKSFILSAGLGLELVRSRYFRLGIEGRYEYLKSNKYFGTSQLTTGLTLHFGRWG